MCDADDEQDAKASENTADSKQSKEPNMYKKAKSVLTASTKSGCNLYDHMSYVLKRFLDERPDNMADIVETASKLAKKTNYKPEAEPALNVVDKSTEVALARLQKKLFNKPEGEDEEGGGDDDFEGPLPNLLELIFYFEQGGVGLNQEEVIRLWLALKQLAENNPIQTVRFWGKIMGTQQNYYIAEVEYREGDEEEEEEEEEPDDIQDEEPPEKELEDDEEEQEEDDTPKPDYKPPPLAPREENRTGVNKRVYFVCNEPGRIWVRLPPATPQQITGARMIRKLFTGHLEAPMVTFPPFPGKEINYLRAQIARISAGTHISPLGFYQFDEEEEEDEEGEVKDNFITNLEFEGIPVHELVHPSLANWVHHVQHILPQGRCTWWNPVQKSEDELEEDEDEDEVEESEGPVPEVGPPLLSPLSEDEYVNRMPPWTACLSTNLVRHYAVACMRSNIWPGAYAFAVERKFENVYVGMGLKYSQDNFSPSPPPPVQEEYPLGPEVTEVDDPTPEEEAALKQAEMEAAEAGEEMEDEEEYEEDEDD